MEKNIDAIIPTSSEYSYDSIRNDLNNTREKAIFYSPSDNTLNGDINLDETIRNKVSILNAKIEEHSAFIVNNKDNVRRIETAEEKILNFREEINSHLLFDEFDGNIENSTEIPSIEKQVFNLKQEVDILKRDYGTALNTAELVFQNQKANETLNELKTVISEVQDEIIPIKEVVNDINNSKVNLNGEKHNSLEQRLIYDFTLLKNDIDMLKSKQIELTLLQDCVNTLLMINNTVIRNQNIESKELDLVDYLVYQIKKEKLDYSAVCLKYPHLVNDINSKLETEV